jgi:hypothetical protein
MAATDQSVFMFVLRETTPERYAVMSADERRQALREWNAWCDDLAGSGILQQGSPLYPEARIVGGRGKSAIDGPFAEAKELIGGYFIIHAADMDEAVVLAEGCPNLQFGMAVEIRPVAQACHLARSLGLTTMREAAAV